jgi:hypothetical protein
VLIYLFVLTQYILGTMLCVVELDQRLVSIFIAILMKHSLIRFGLILLSENENFVQKYRVPVLIYKIIFNTSIFYVHY